MDVDTFLSDVHVGTFNPLSSQGTCVTRFSFSLTQSGANHAPLPSQVELDEDGDMIVVRRTQQMIRPIFIEHAMSTTLEAVGQQVWRGALLMVDYLLSQGSTKLKDSVVLELGAGTGLVSIIAGSTARRVFCSDTGKSLLELCQRNIEENCRAKGDESDTVVLVRELDWCKPFRESSSTEFSWTKEDRTALADVSVILASDVVYDNELTSAFLNCLAHVCSLVSQPPTILISLEKRINFSIEKLSIASPYYEHFRRCLELSYSTSRGKLKFRASQITTDFPQFSVYDRVKELELWQLTVNFLQE